MKSKMYSPDSTPLGIIYRKGCGLIAELEREIGKASVRQLEAMGYIENAPSQDGDTWKITLCARKRGDLIFQEITWIERLKDWFYLNVCKIDFGR